VTVTGSAFILAACSSFVVSLYACVFARRFALRRALLDQPNERSLHQVPVPRLGGAAIVIGTYAVAGVMLLREGVAADLAIWLGMALPVALLGLIDDLRPLSAGARFSVQLLICAGLCALLPPPHEIALTPAWSVSVPVPLSAAGCAIWMLAVLNIYNFMDGMDGLAGIQAVGAALSLALAALAAGHSDLALLCLVIMAAAGGFLVHNAPPAKLFMGDVGSTFLGFGFAAISVIGLRRPEPIAWSPALFGLAPFLCDGTFTLLRRLSRGEKIWQAHKSHLYQRAVATGLTHHEVLVPYCAWVALGVAAAALDVQTHGQSTGVIACVMIASFGAVWLWVNLRERQRSPSAQST
jgi:UDP-N-acetylmuramyl pentapeptide phosphotransferase/UDP-N-acetylglucosamine-1-phosphate transferase